MDLEFEQKLAEHCREEEGMTEEQRDRLLLEIAQDVKQIKEMLQ